MLKIPSNTIVLMKFGSHLYGTNTANSDMDYKGIFIPDARDILLQKVPKSLSFSSGNDHSKNTSSDTDAEIYSLSYFVRLACEGQTVAIDMLHAPDSMCEKTSREWKFIVENRSKFYTKNIHAFIGYAQRQAAKYGVKGSRLNAAKEFIDFCSGWTCQADRLEEVWLDLPIGEHSRYLEPSPEGVQQYEICGKTLQSTGTIEYSRSVIEKFYNNYGERAKLAAINQGIDWKAVSHAIRAALQVKELLTEGTITFPLKERELLLKVKTGQLDYLGYVAPLLEDLIVEVKEIAEKSNLPEKADVKFWEEFVVYEYGLEVFVSREEDGTFYSR